MSEKLRVSVDPVRCQAYGLCVAINPDVFDIPAGQPVAILLRDIVDGEDLAEVNEAIRSCPAQAISVMPAVAR